MPFATPTHAGRLLPLTAFHAWLARAKPGERLEYYRGHLAHDRVKGTSRLRESDRRKLTAVADHASAVAGQGKLHLVQQRHGYADYSYLAIARALSGSFVARMRLPATAAQDETAIADAADPQAEALHHMQLSTTGRFLEREEAME